MIKLILGVAVGARVRVAISFQLLGCCFSRLVGVGFSRLNDTQAFNQQ